MSEPIITQSEIDKIADLASLDLTPEEKSKFVSQFKDILAYFKMIDAVSLPELHDHATDAANHLRDDVVVPSGVTPDTFSPHMEDGHFKVPKVIE